MSQKTKFYFHFLINSYNSIKCHQTKKQNHCSMDILMCSYYYALCAKDDLHREHVFQSRTPHKPCWKKSDTLTLSIFPFSVNVYASISKCPEITIHKQFQLFPPQKTIMIPGRWVFPSIWTNRCPEAEADDRRGAIILGGCLKIQPFDTFHTYAVLCLWYHNIPFYTIPCHTIPCHIVPYCTKPNHTLPYHWVQ